MTNTEPLASCSMRVSFFIAFVWVENPSLFVVVASGMRGSFPHHLELLLGNSHLLKKITHPKSHLLVGTVFIQWLIHMMVHTPTWKSSEVSTSILEFHGADWRLCLDCTTAQLLPLPSPMPFWSQAFSNISCANPYLRICFLVNPACNVPLFWGNFYSSYKNSDQRSLYLKPPPSVPIQSPLLDWVSFLLLVFPSHPVYASITSITEILSHSLSQYLPTYVFFFLELNWVVFTDYLRSRRKSTNVCIRYLNSSLSSPGKFSICPYLCVNLHNN